MQSEIWSDVLRLVTFSSPFSLSCAGDINRRIWFSLRFYLTTQQQLFPPHEPASYAQNAPSSATTRKMSSPPMRQARRSSQAYPEGHSRRRSSSQSGIPVSNTGVTIPSICILPLESVLILIHCSSEQAGSQIPCQPTTSSLAIQWLPPFSRCSRPFDSHKTSDLVSEAD